jgi:hypothetical protein
MESDETTSATLYEGTAAALLEFLDYARAKGILARKTADAYKSASSLVLSIEGEGWEATDLRNVDLDQQVNRYIRLRGQKASPQTLATYRQRVAKAIDLYLDFLGNPAGFRGPAGRPRKAVGGGRRQNGPSVSNRPTQQPAHGREATVVEPADLITYPFPLRSGAMAYLQLPRQLSEADVKRLSTFLQSLAIDGDDTAASQREPKG